MPTFQPIDRRTVLRGAGGVALALPSLEAMGAPNREPIAAPKRIFATGTFYGLVPDHFHPKRVGREYELPRLLKPLANHRDDMTVFSGLDHNLGGGHVMTKYFLNGISVEHSRGFAEGNVSLDQKAAQYARGSCRYPSLVLGCETNSANYISWTHNSNAVSPLQNPTELFDLLFRTPTQSERKRASDAVVDQQSILDLVQGRADRFKHKLSQSDTAKLDQYFTSVRELEKKLQQSSQWIDRPKPSTEYQLERAADALTLSEKTPIIYDLIALALQTDSTRVVTLSFSELGKSNGGLDGVRTGYHSLSHHGKVQETIEELSIVETFFASQFSRFLTKLKEIEEPNGESLLDSTMALFGSGMSNGNSHSNRDLPVLLAGGGFRHGEHQHYDRDGSKSVPLCNLYLSMLQQFGLEIDRFNTSTGTLTNLHKVG